jgi:hypothetical protein
MTGKAKKPPTDAQMKAKAIARWNNEGGAPASGDVSVRKRPKRPRDPNQLAKRIVDIATGEAEDRDPDDGKDPAAVALGREGGLKGGKARASKLTPEQRAEIARKAAQSRWGKP